MYQIRKVVFVLSAMGALALASCATDTVETSAVEMEALLETDFDDARAVSFERNGLLVTELFDLDDTLVASLEHDDLAGVAALRLATGFEDHLPTPSGTPLELQQELLHNVWSSHSDAEDETTDYGSRCFIGDSPRIEITCYQTYCRYPSPYDYYGGVPWAWISRSECETRAASCGASDSWYHEYCYWYGSYYSCSSYCVWWGY